MFHNRAVNFWYKLPDSIIVLATSITCFKRRLLSFVLNFGSKHFLQTSISLGLHLSFGACINVDFLFIFYGQLLVEVASYLEVPVQCMLRYFMLHFWTNKFIHLNS